ncbi:spermine oxidase-like [Microplitis demolitor]|uniref:spermine oxidase-like n=1 Tax=Microplitis demolitor TaxID=69319 RepID=UPI0004CD3B7B|nr:spermine oxidase-like [Microplitis demolitor]
MRLLILLCFTTCVLSSEDIPPRVIVVGSGASGIAAASRLLQYGFNNTTILEAENRIGGRIYSIEMGDYLVDMGAQWVHGEKSNVVFELAGPLGLLERFSDSGLNFNHKIFGSSGVVIPESVATPLIDYFINNVTHIYDDIDNLKTGSFGEYAEPKLYEYFKNHPEITTDQYQPLLHSLNMMRMEEDAESDWYEISARAIRDFEGCEGDHEINWKNRTYSTILDILMKKYPNPEKELPVKDIIKLNTKVTEIKFDETPLKVTTADGQEYFADYVIVTSSLGVIKKNYNKLFNPPLPEKKLLAINNISYGGVAKIILYYENPWWLHDPIYGRNLYWTEKDRKELENDPKKKWMLGVYRGLIIEHKPKLFLLWVCGPYVREMELTPEALFQDQVKQLVTKFFGKAYNLTEPTIIKRSLWNTNENFLGTYSSHGVKYYTAGAHIEDYAEPIMNNNKPVLLFAGEGTSVHYGMVHGAIETGWREANRIIIDYSKNI